MFFKSKGNIEYLIAGLGNPGLEYEKTRHNSGFMALDIFAEKYGIDFSKHKFNAHIGDGVAENKRVLICKPLTYMNNSGEAISKICSFYKIPAEKVIVLSDDIDIGIGRVRIRRKGSAGGHNGLKSIIALLGSEEFIRVKIGVGDRADRQSDLKNHVLGKVSKEDLKEFQNSLDNAALAVGEILKNGVDSAMNIYSK